MPLLPAAHWSASFAEEAKGVRLMSAAVVAMYNHRQKAIDGPLLVRVQTIMSMVNNAIVLSCRLYTEDATVPTISTGTTETVARLPGRDKQFGGREHGLTPIAE